MKITKGISIGAVVLGLAFLGGAHYIETEVSHGRAQVEGAEQSLKRGQSLFSLTPATDQIGQGIQRSADRKLGEARQEIDFYSALAQLLQISGYLLIIGGVIMFVVLMRRHK
jgi:hypothetical protein